MTLHDLMQFEDYDDYAVWWYGKDIYQEYMTDDGLIRKYVDVKKGVNLDGRIYLVLSGISGNKCKYCYQII